MIYNTFPLMGDSLMPPGLLALEPWHGATLFDNMTTVQFNHRLPRHDHVLSSSWLFWWRGRSAARFPQPGLVRLQQCIAGYVP